MNRKPTLSESESMNSKTRIVKWIDTGELGGEPKTVGDLIENLGRLLDKSCAHDIVGRCVFKAANGKHYVVNVEAVITESGEEFTDEA